MDSSECRGSYETREKLLKLQGVKIKSNEAIAGGRSFIKKKKTRALTRSARVLPHETHAPKGID